MAQVLEIVLANGRDACIQRLRAELERARMQIAEHETRAHILNNDWQSAYRREQRGADRAYMEFWISNAHNTLLANRLRTLGESPPSPPPIQPPFDYSDSDSDFERLAGL